MLLVLVCPIADFAKSMHEDRPGEAVACLALVEFPAGFTAQFRILQPVESYVEYGWQEEKTNLPSPFPTISTRHEKRSRVA